MRVQVEVPIRLSLIPPPLVQQAMGGLDPERVKALFGNVVARLEDLGRLAVATWQTRITQIPGRTGRPLRLGTGPADPMVQLNRTTYAASVRLAPAEWLGEALSVSVYSESAQAEPIESGTPGGDMDLHAVLPYAPKARLSKAGHLYLRIPFRHATVSAEGGPVLPKAVVQTMKPKAKYLILGTYQEPSVTRPGQQVTRFRYSANPGRLTLGEMQAINARAMRDVISPTMARRLEGLMRTGAKGHGGYLTIRTLSQANPDGWRVPAYPAQHLLQAVAEEVGQAAPTWFDEAIQADIAAWMAQAGAVSA